MQRPIAGLSMFRRRLTLSHAALRQCTDRDHPVLSSVGHRCLVTPLEIMDTDGNAILRSR